MLRSPDQNKRGAEASYEPPQASFLKVQCLRCDRFLQNPLLGVPRPRKTPQGRGSHPQGDPRGDRTQGDLGGWAAAPSLLCSGRRGLPGWRGPGVLNGKVTLRVPLPCWARSCPPSLSPRRSGRALGWEVSGKREGASRGHCWNVLSLSFCSGVLCSHQTLQAPGLITSRSFSLSSQSFIVSGPARPSG